MTTVPASAPTNAEINAALDVIKRHEPAMVENLRQQLKTAPSDAEFDRLALKIIAAAQSLQRRIQSRAAEEPPPSQGDRLAQPSRRLSPPIVQQMPELIARFAVWLLIISFGGIFFAVNGGFSVIGLGVIAQSFNEAGKIAWLFLTDWTFTVPIKLPLFTAQQPVLPWIGVVGGSLLQIAIVWMRFSKLPVARWMYIAAIAMSGYDYGTTLFGLGTVAWVQQVGWIVQVPIAAVLTFGLEFAVGALLPRLSKR